VCQQTAQNGHTPYKILTGRHLLIFCVVRYGTNKHRQDEMNESGVPHPTNKNTSQPEQVPSHAHVRDQGSVIILRPRTHTRTGRKACQRRTAVDAHLSRVRSRKADKRSSADRSMLPLWSTPVVVHHPLLSIGAKDGAAFVQHPLLSIPPPCSPHTPYPSNRNRLVSNPWTHNTEWKKAEAEETIQNACVISVKRDLISVKRDLIRHSIRYAEETMQNASMQNFLATSNGYDAKGIKGHGIKGRKSRQANHARDKRKGNRRERAREEGGGPR
jgi:hypothetical protein